MLFTGCGGAEGEGGAQTDDRAAESAQSQEASLAQAEKETAAQLIQKLSEAGDVGPGTEWSIIGIARSSLGKDPEAQTLFTQYEESLRLQVKRSDGVLDPDRPTDNARAAIALKLLGRDPTDVEGYDLLQQQEDTDAVKSQGINAEIWALNAAACCGRDLKAEEVYLSDICGMRSESGGISYDGETADIDITAMAIQTLAPYAGQGGEIDETIDSARKWLSEQQTDQGDYGNSESTSQVILAVAALGEDPLAAEDFIKGEGLLGGQLKYQRLDGFCHLDEETMDVMATEQALCALDAMQLAAQGQMLMDNGR